MNAFTHVTSIVGGGIRGILYKGVGRRLMVLAVAAAGAAGLGMAPARASAHFRHHHHDGEVVVVNPVVPAIGPVCADVVAPAPCPPARVWVEPQVRIVTEQVFIPDRFEERTIARTDRWGQTFYRTRTVLVEPAHYETRTHEEVVVPGRWD